MNVKNTILYYNYIFLNKKFKNLKILSLIILFGILLFSISCKKVNILSPTHIPPETQFKVYTNISPSQLDINPQPAKDGEVFGGFRKKFIYKGEWYVLADYKYIYDKASKTLKEDAKNVILKIENGGKITIYNENTGSQAWNHLVYNMNVIESDKVIYEPYNYYSKFSYNLKGVRLPHGFYDGGTFYYDNRITVDNIFYSSKNLITWVTNGSTESFYHKLPDIKNNNWQGEWGMSYFTVIMFKNYVYVIGLTEEFGEQNDRFKRKNDLPPCIMSKDKYYRINYKYNDYGGAIGWEEYATPFGKRSSLTIKYDNNKIYARCGYISGYAHDPNIQLWTNFFTNVIDDKVYSTTDGINWNIETDLKYYNYAISVGSVGNFPENMKRTKTPAEPNWIKDNKNIYYKSANTTLTINNKTYYLPIPPANEIMEAAKRGETNFTITKKHILNGGYNQFMLSDKSPYVSEYDWKLIAPLEYTGYSIIWQIGDANMLFNINGEIIQLMDYSRMNYFLNSAYSDYLPVINELKSKAITQRQYAERYNNYYSYYYQAMYYEAQADMITEIFNNIEYIKPEQAITHYKIEFKHH